MTALPTTAIPRPRYTAALAGHPAGTSVYSSDTLIDAMAWVAVTASASWATGWSITADGTTIATGDPE